MSYIYVGFGILVNHTGFWKNYKKTVLFNTNILNLTWAEKQQSNFDLNYLFESSRKLVSK